MGWISNITWVRHWAGGTNGKHYIAFELLLFWLAGTDDCTDTITADPRYTKYSWIRRLVRWDVHPHLRPKHYCVCFELSGKYRL